MYIKVFRFRVSNWSSSPCSDDRAKTSYYDAQAQLASENEIAKTINKFISDKNVISISVNTVDVAYHNNARGNTIDLIYTILWKN